MGEAWTVGKRDMNIPSIIVGAKEARSLAEEGRRGKERILYLDNVTHLTSFNSSNARNSNIEAGR